MRRARAAVALLAVVSGGGAAACTLLAGVEDLTVHDAAALHDAAKPDVARSGDAASDAATHMPLRKVDILFDIDNSSSMGDKQSLLVEAFPRLITRLATPNCVDSTGAPTGAVADPTTGQCTSGSPEFAPIHDMHIGVVTSSLGPRLGTAFVIDGMSAPVCANTQVTSQAGATVSPFTDDHAHLINRTTPYGGGPPIPEAALPEGGGFLYWYPAVSGDAAPPVTPPQPITSLGDLSNPMPDTLADDFSEIVGNTGESGCGIESQLESWYRFLIQPDPYLTLVSENGVAEWSGVDTTILQQRHDFLRPDSVVVVVVLTDEDDSEIDVRSIGGSAYQYMSELYEPVRATTACSTDPNSPDCASCAYCGTPGGPPPSVCDDPNCRLNGGRFNLSQDRDDWGFDLNLRHVHMAQKYGPEGVGVQYPLTRYFNGLTSPRVPNRLGEYPPSARYYVGTNNCTNPLFAAALPTASDVSDPDAGTPTEIDRALCALPAGAARTPADVFFVHIGGVPYQLVNGAVADPAGCAANCNGSADAGPSYCVTECASTGTLTAANWVTILGKGAAGYPADGGAISYDYTGIDPHMIESMIPRNELGASQPLCSASAQACPGAIEPAPASSPEVTSLVGPDPVADAGDPLRPDPINGREWTTYEGTHSLLVDREYACIFPLPPTSQRDCAALPEETLEENSCDCPPKWNETGTKPLPPNNTPDEISPLCSKASSDGKTITSRVNDYTVQIYGKAYPTIRELTLTHMMGAQGVVGSICPVHVVDNAAGDDPLFAYRPTVDALVSRMKGVLSP